MTNSQDLASIAVWMMLIGGVGGLIGVTSIIQSDGLDRGDLSKPLTIVGLGIFFLGAFLDYRWGTFW